MQLLPVLVNCTRNRFAREFKAYPRILLKPSVCKYFPHASINKRGRTLSSTVPERPEKSKSESQTQSFTVIYRFPHIVLVRVISRLKLLQTGIAACAIPATAVLSNMQYLDEQFFYTTTSIGLFACAMLYAMSELTRRAVGAMYIDERRQLVKISHLTFWGARRDIVVPVEDIIPLADVSEKPTNLYVKLKRYSTTDELYFTIKYGRIFDADAFKFVFGELNPST